jgi:aryl-alcohol dehydrogenase-like predicted oxidoreductase
LKHKQLGKSGIYLTDLSLGTMTFGETTGRGTPAEEAHRIIHHYLDHGGNHIDAANVYAGGRSEEIVGEAIKNRRSNLILATKVNFPMGDDINDKGLSRYNIIRGVEGSLKRLKTDYIDLLYMHAWDFVTPIDESLRAFDDLVRSGKVRYIGASNFKAWHLMKSLSVSDRANWSRFVAAQYQYSLVKRDIEYEYVELFEEEGLGLLPWGPLGGGFLSGKYKRDQRPTDFSDGRIGGMSEDTEEAWDRRNTERNWAILDVVGNIAEQRAISYPQVAIAWLRAQSVVTSVILGTRTFEQLEDNLGAAEVDLTQEELDLLNEVSRPHELYPYRFLENYARK